MAEGRHLGGQEDRESRVEADGGIRISIHAILPRMAAARAVVRAYFTHPNEDLRAVRMTWWGGFCGLPLLWLLNWINFRKAVQEADALTELKILVRLSLFLFGLALAIFGTWLAYFQTVTETLVCPCDGPFGSDFRYFSHPTRTLFRLALLVVACEVCVGPKILSHICVCFCIAAHIPDDVCTNLFFPCMCVCVCVCVCVHV